MDYPEWVVHLLNGIGIKLIKEIPMKIADEVENLLEVYTILDHCWSKEESQMWRYLFENAMILYTNLNIIDIQDLLRLTKHEVGVDNKDVLKRFVKEQYNKIIKKIYDVLNANSCVEERVIYTDIHGQELIEGVTSSIALMR